MTPQQKLEHRKELIRVTSPTKTQFEVVNGGPHGFPSCDWCRAIEEKCSLAEAKFLEEQFPVDDKVCAKFYVNIKCNRCRHQELNKAVYKYCKEHATINLIPKSTVADCRTKSGREPADKDPLVVRVADCASCMFKRSCDNARKSHREQWHPHTLSADPESLKLVPLAGSVEVDSADDLGIFKMVRSNARRTNQFYGPATLRSGAAAIQQSAYPNTRQRARQDSEQAPEQLSLQPILTSSRQDAHRGTLHQHLQRLSNTHVRSPSGEDDGSAGIADQPRAKRGRR